MSAKEEEIELPHIPKRGYPVDSTIESEIGGSSRGSDNRNGIYLPLYHWGRRGRPLPLFQQTEKVGAEMIMLIMGP